MWNPIAYKESPYKPWYRRKYQVFIGTNKYRPFIDHGENFKIVGCFRWWFHRLITWKKRRVYSKFLFASLDLHMRNRELERTWWLRQLTEVREPNEFKKEMEGTYE